MTILLLKRMQMEMALYMNSDQELNSKKYLGWAFRISFRFYLVNKIIHSPSKKYENIILEISSFELSEIHLFPFLSNIFHLPSHQH